MSVDDKAPDPKPPTGTRRGRMLALMLLSAAMSLGASLPPGHPLKSNPLDDLKDPK